jgi:Na+/H+ antiporter NhaD/arsenite permease-like protein
MALAVGIFALALAAIASERVHRTKVALVGAGLMVVTQTIDQEQAIAAIDFNTIGLLAGMMLMVKVTETTGVYTWACDPCRSALARRAARRRDRLRRLGERFVEHQ